LRLMFMRRESLSEAQEQKLRGAFSRNPALQTVYDFSQELCELLRIRRQNKEQCRELVARLLAYIDELCRSPFKPMSSLDSWKEEIARMFRFSKNNGITEGFHRKMKLIQRRAYGVLNFENYRLSVRVLCGSAGENRTPEWTPQKFFAPVFEVEPILSHSAGQQLISSRSPHPAFTPPHTNLLNFPNLWGRVWGKNAPHTKKGLRFYSKSLNFLGVPKGIIF